MHLPYSAYWSTHENHHFSFLMGGDFHMWSCILLALPSLRKVMDFLQSSFHPSYKRLFLGTYSLLEVSKTHNKIFKPQLNLWVNSLEANFHGVKQEYHPPSCVERRERRRPREKQDGIVRKK